MLTPRPSLASLGLSRSVTIFCIGTLTYKS